MSNLMSAPRKALLTHLEDLPDNRSLQNMYIAEVAGISPRSATAFRNALIEDDLVSAETWFWPNGKGIGHGIRITAKGREALKKAALPEVNESRKVDDRSAELAKTLANPAITRANATDLYQYLVLEQPEPVAKRNMAHVEEVLSLLNSVVRIQAGRR